MQFDPEIAKIVGTDAAIIYSNIEFWVYTNETNNRHFYDGYYWMFNSVKAFQKQFSYLTEKQIRTCLKKLEDNSYLIAGNYNEKNYDKTKWYRTHCPNGQMELPKRANGCDQMGKPIPDNKQYNKPDTSIDIEKTPKQIAISFFNLEDNQENRDIILPLREKYGQSIDLEIKKFISYWTEHTPSGKKQRWEIQKTFEVKRRLITWLGNCNNKQQKEQRTIIGMDKYNF